MPSTVKWASMWARAATATASRVGTSKSSVNYVQCCAGGGPTVVRRMQSSEVTLDFDHSYSRVFPPICLSATSGFYSHR